MRGCWGFVGEAQTLDGPEPFNRELLDALAEVMDSQFATYYEFDRLQRTQYGYVNCSLEARYASPVPTEGRRLPEEANVNVAADQVWLWSDSSIDRPDGGSRASLLRRLRDSRLRVDCV